MLTLADTLLIGPATDLFSGGFLVVEPLRSPLRFSAFLAASFLFDLVLVLAIWTVVLPLARGLRLAPRQVLAVAAFAALAPPLGFLYVRYQLSRFMGELLDPSLLLALAGGSIVEWFAQGSAHLVPVAGVILAALAVGALLVRTLRTHNPGVPLLTPGARGAAALGAVAFAGSSLVLPGACLRSTATCEALGHKPSGIALAAVLQRLTDFDLDGYGLVLPPLDTAPFDSVRHPFALDVPGNGIDENGLAGDHPADYVAPESPLVERPVFARRPHVLLVFLEGMRADVIDRRLGEREITPFLNRLAREGASSEHAFANSPYTARSRGQLLGGRLAPFPGQSTLLDDFHANGYTIAWFSGQDESFGARESAMLGLERTDVHYDARDDKEHSVSAFRTSGSLAVSWKRVNQRASELLAGWDPARPLFLYVNYGDTHFPYDHAELDDLLGAPRLTRSRIQPDDPNGVFATYANSAANVDRAIQALYGDFRARLGTDDVVLIVTSDHGEALFEDGVLGHGLALDPTQTRVPLVVHGLGGEWPEPFGLSDLRSAVQRALTEHASERRARFAPMPRRYILQYMAQPESPRLLCLRALNGELHYDTSEPGRVPKAAFVELIRFWEAVQLGAAAREAGG